jgi:hypothetical protein
MDYYFWVNGYENAGVVKADTVDEGKQKVIMSTGKCKSIEKLDDLEFDNYNVCTLIS